MKKIVLILGVIMVLFSNLHCLKGSNNSVCTTNSVQSEQPQIVSFASSNGISATADPSGLYYQIINPGTGVQVTSISKVSLTYTGSLLNGSVFDQQTNSSFFTITNLITGLQIGVTMLKKGGSIKLIVPSALGYGCQTVGVIPGNSVLYFEVTVVDVQ